MLSRAAQQSILKWYEGLEVKAQSLHRKRRQMSKLLEIFGKAITTNTAELIWHWLNAVKDTQANKDKYNRLEPVMDLLANMELEQAKESLKLYLFEKPDCTMGRMLSAAICLHGKDLNGAIKELQSVYLREPNNTMALYALGHCYERMGHEAEAVEFYQDCIKFKRHLELPRQRLAAIYLKKGEIAKTIQQYEQLRIECPDDVASLVILGHLYIMNTDYDSAIDTFNTAILVHPDNFHIDPEYEDINEMMRLGEHDSAVERLLNQIEARPQAAELYVQLADIMAATGRFAEAIVNYEKATRIQPSYLEAAVKLGSLYVAMKRSVLAAEQFNRAVEINDEIVDAYVGLAKAQKLAGEVKNAITTLSLAAAIQENSSLLFAETAKLQFHYTIKGHCASDTAIDETPLIGQVIEAHHRQLDSHSQNFDLQYRYALLLLGIGESAAAAKAFEQVLAINPTHHRAQTKFALCLYEQERQTEAIEQLDETQRLNIETLVLHYKTAILYCDTKLFAAAVQNMRHNIEPNFDVSETNATISAVLQNLGLQDRAVASWDSLQEVARSALKEQ